MRYNALAGIADKVSVLCLGTMNFGASTDEKTSFEIMDAFFDMGGNFIDTARLYGEPDGVGAGASEKVIGRWMKERGNRHQIVLATKGGHPPLDDMDSPRLDKKSLESDLDASLAALDTDVIDLYWLHRDDERLSVEEILDTMNALVLSGKIRTFGASNWRTERIAEAEKIAKTRGIMGFSGNQPMWSLALNGDGETLRAKHLVQMDREMYAFHASCKMPCIPYSSQGKGLFNKLAAGQEDMIRGKTRSRYLNAENLRRFEVLKAMNRESGMDIGVISLAYLTCQQAFPTFPIAAVSKMAQMDTLRMSADANLPGDMPDRLLREAGLTK